MKQNLPPARAAAFVILFLPALALCLSSCATLPRHSSPDTQVTPGAAKLGSSIPLNINVASAGELERLPGVGKAIAERIVTYRAEYGPFRRVEHLMMVRGISDRKFRNMREMIVSK